MNSILINVDVPNLKTAIDFYTKAFDLKLSRQIGPSAVELLGFPAPIYLLEKKEGSVPFEGAKNPRSFKRHWTPVHLDIVVESIELAIEKTKAAGGIHEGEIHTAVWGKIAYFSDPFGNGLCLVQFVGKGYDEI